MSWITDDWRLKLLALGLAILMLGAVAFAQNPPTTGTVKVPIHYKPATTLVLINPPATISVTFSGLSDVIGTITAANFSASVDPSHASPGPAVKLNVSVTSTANVNVQNPAPIVVHIDTRQEKDLPVQVVANPATGWLITKMTAIPDTVHFTGPASWEDHLVAFVNWGTPVSGQQTQEFSQTIQLQNINGALDLEPCITVPCATIDVATATIQITAQTGSSSSTVPLVVAAPTHPPPAGYELTGILPNPLSVIVTGDPATLAKIQRITLPGVDLSNSTTTVTFTINIPYPDGISPLGPKAPTTATVTFTIQRNPNVSPSP